MDSLEILCQRAKNASKILKQKGTNDKNSALTFIAEALLENEEAILCANNKDIENAKMNKMAEGMIDRLTLTKERIVQMAEGVKQVAALSDPIGEIISMETLPNGLKVGKRRTPLGVAGVIYESRPNVTVDTAVLCLKASNAVILRGGSDAYFSNKALSDVMRDAILKAGIPSDAICFMEDTSRETVTKLMKMNDYLDVLIPRGGAGLIKSVVENSTVPVIETGTGNCHIYVDKSADVNMAKDIIINAKTSRTSVCNAAESLLIHKDVAPVLFEVIGSALKEKGVEIRGCERSMKLLPCDALATEEDFGKEFLSLIISVKIVDSIDEAISHIEKYSTGHSECIVTSDYACANKFLDLVDSAAVYVNASTRFTDGFEFGLGAEIGISTQKLHARGPMGIKELTTYKYIILGSGQVR
ncbi:MAG: glutamate-5-semialdehyde dehydrogenase [Ruminococcaceae bacterium]|nr:glutamate-5-semialdehyde dehydrogenase [Oscillospiraceae bacterium]